MNPCQNNGVCLTINEKSYYCLCINDYIGLNCQYYKNKEFINSTILTNKQIIEDLFNLTKFEKKQWKLIYRGSRDGFGANNFHSKCDNNPNTLTLIKTTKSFIFGGFTRRSWNPRIDYYIDDSEAFLISLVNYKNKPVKLNKNKRDERAIGAIANFGPIFGGYGENVHDIIIFSNSNLKDINICKPYSYELEKGKLYDENLLAGQTYFQTLDIETYTIN